MDQKPHYIAVIRHEGTKGEVGIWRSRTLPKLITKIRKDCAPPTKPSEYTEAMDRFIRERFRTMSDQQIANAMVERFGKPFTKNMIVRRRHTIGAHK